MSQQVTQAIVIGASGYGGAQLAALLLQHPVIQLQALLVSPTSADRGVAWHSLYPEYWSPHGNDFVLASYDHYFESHEWKDIDTVFLATPHEASVEIAAKCFADGKQVIDLSGAFRIKDLNSFTRAYGFTHQQPKLLAAAEYGLPEIARSNLSNKSLIAVAGCYPTASILGLKPLVDNYQLSGIPVINAVSGVSGAGRKSSLTTSFCEVSLQAYGIGAHRHQPEIEQALAQKVVFTPHLGAFKRGILATIVVPVVNECDHNKLSQMYCDYYNEKCFVKVVTDTPAIKDVVHTPFAKIGVKWLSDTSMAHITVAIDNLMKGAASSAIQCFNLSRGLDESLGLLSTENLKSDEQAC